MSGQPPYVPFENDKVQWKPPTSEISAPVLASAGSEQLEARRPAILLFLSGSDSGSCCAANYERSVFRDQKLVKLASSKFVVVRLDRGGATPELLKRYKVTRKRPALLITDCEGEIHARWDLCANPPDVFKAMLSCLSVSKKKERNVVKQQARFDDVKTLMDQQSYRGAGNLLKKILRTKGGFVAGYAKARRLWSEIGKTGRGLYSEAMDRTAVTERYDELLHLRREFWFFTGLSKQVRAEITKLEQGQDTQDAIHAYLGLKLLRMAETMLEDGKRAKGRSVLLKVRREYPGTPAAKRAEELLG